MKDPSPGVPVTEIWSVLYHCPYIWRLHHTLTGDQLFGSIDACTERIFGRVTSGIGNGMRQHEPEVLVTATHQGHLNHEQVDSMDRDSTRTLTDSRAERGDMQVRYHTSHYLKSA